MSCAHNLAAVGSLAAEPENVIADHPWSLLAAIVNSSNDAIVSKDLNGIVKSWNPAATRIFGYTSDEMIGEPILKIIPAELHEEEAHILAKIRAGERIEDLETIRMAKDGSRVDVSLTISPIRDETGRLIGSSKIARDITSRKKLENLLLQSEKLATAGRMAATIAHEINNPLEAVMNLLFLARQSCPRDSDTGRFLLTAESEVERVGRIARTTLGFYRANGEPGDTCLRELVEGAVQIFESKLKARRIEVRSEFHQDRSVKARRGELMQVFSNLITNSMDAMPTGGTLRIRIADLADVVRVTFEDSGVGIDEENIARVFEPFFTTKPEVGTGIGLWVTRQLIEGHGGRIFVNSSTRPGRSGTKVTIDLPYPAPGPVVAGSLAAGQ